MWKQGRLFWLMMGLCCVGAACVEAGETPLRITNEWAFSRTWKSAKKNKYHFYEGTLPFRNEGKDEMQSLRAHVSILDTEGNTINSSNSISFGTLAPGQTGKKSFIIERAVQFSEMIVKAYCTIAGKERVFTFSTTSGTKAPEPIGMDAGVLELRILAEEIDKTILGKREDKVSTLKVRLRNLAAVPAMKPTVKIHIRLASTKSATSSKKSKKKRRKKSKKKKKEEDVETPPVQKQSGGKALIEVVLDEAALAPGATKTYTKSIKMPDYEGYSMVASATWPDPEETTEVISEGGAVTGDAATLAISPIKLEAKGNGKSDIVVTVTNHATEIKPGELEVSFFFFDEKEKEFASVKHVIQQTIGKEKAVTVRIPDQPFTAYRRYEMGTAFLNPAP